MQLHTNADWPSGIYHVAVANSKGRVLHVGSFILK